VAKRSRRPPRLLGQTERQRVAVSSNLDTVIVGDVTATLVLAADATLASTGA
jgi:hypothetical protein